MTVLTGGDASRILTASTGLRARSDIFPEYHS